MSYQLSGQESIAHGIRRIAREQIESAIEELTDTLRSDRGKAIHNARKHFKKIRALVRLVRDELGSEHYHVENACFREVGQRLSSTRDAKVRIDTLDQLLRHFQDTVTADAFDSIRQALVAQYESAFRAEAQSQDTIAELVSTLRTARDRVKQWPIHNHDWATLSGGLQRIYKQGRMAFFRASKHATPENRHEWRKRAKDLWYHVRLLAPIWPDYFKLLDKQLEQLANDLGDDHDLTVLHAFILDNLEALTPSTDAVAVLLTLIQQRQLDLQLHAQALGQRLYAEKPRIFIQRMGGYWQTWRTETEHPPIALPPQVKDPTALAVTSLLI